jgi:hypothetical protein
METTCLSPWLRRYINIVMLLKEMPEQLDDSALLPLDRLKLKKYEPLTGYNNESSKEEMQLRKRLNENDLPQSSLEALHLMVCVRNVEDLAMLSEEMQEQLDDIAMFPLDRPNSKHTVKGYQSWPP